MVISNKRQTCKVK